MSRSRAMFCWMLRRSAPSTRILVDDADDLRQLFFGQILGATLRVDAASLRISSLLVGPTP
jgi:hypothetical protein